LEQLENTIVEQMERWEVPGIAVGILHDGQIEFVGHGIANVETGAPVAPETLFQVGSISKVFTATLLMTLVDEGRVDIDEPVVTYVPELVLRDPAARETITLRHLLTHTAGFYGDRFDDHGEGDDALARAVAAFADLPQQTPPGETWTYCNAGIDLVGRVIENVLGTTFESAMRTRVFEPLGLERSTYFAREAILHSVAAGHAGGGGEPVRTVAPWPVPRRTNPAGGVVSNVLELIRFAGCHLNDGSVGPARIIAADSAIRMRTIQTVADFGRSWGFGWLMRPVGDTHTVEHGGATNGFTARLLTVPERTFAIAVLTNSDNGSAAHGAIANAALKQFLDLASPELPSVTVAPEAVQALQGHFRHDLADITFSVDGNGLVMNRVDHEPFRSEDEVIPPARARALSASELVIEEGIYEGVVAEFFWNTDGSPRFIRIGGRLGFPVD
jgi:CubicO group peptidase (beta-lactamase class C family)